MTSHQSRELLHLGRGRATPGRADALSNGTRLSIIQRLRLGERCVCDSTDALDAAQSRLSFHLKVLKDAELVSDRRDWRWIYYTLTTDTLAEGASWWMRWRPLRRQRSGNHQLFLMIPSTA